MSRGLGKLERGILEYLSEHESWISRAGVNVIGANVLHPERFDPESGDDISEDPYALTHSEYKAMCRALRSLERKGYVTKEKHTDMLTSHGTRGGWTHSFIYTLTSMQNCNGGNTYGTEQ